MTVDEVDQEAIQEVLRVVVTIHGQEVILVVNQDHQEVQIREVDKDLKLKHNHNESRTPSRENLKRKRSESVTDRNGNNNNNNNNLQDLLNNLK